VNNLVLICLQILNLKSTKCSYFQRLELMDLCCHISILLLDTVIWLVVRFSLTVKEGLVRVRCKIFVCEDYLHWTIWKTLGREFKWRDVLLVHWVDSDSLSFTERGRELVGDGKQLDVRCDVVVLGLVCRNWLVKKNKGLREYWGVFCTACRKTDSAFEEMKCAFQLKVPRPVFRDETPNCESNLY
jgi:hypothetical protein